jgi:recombination protein RecA
MAKAAAAPIKYHAKLAKFFTLVKDREEIQEAIVKPSFKMEYINSGSTVINLLIGGTRIDGGEFICPGWPRGRISEVFGRESSGKSTIALMALGQVVAAGGCGMYVDLEHAVVDNYAMRLGADFRSPELGGTGAAIRIAPNFAEEVEIAVNAAAIAKVDLIIIDSVAALQCKREVNRDVIDDKKMIAETPRFMSDWMPKLQSIIAKTGTHVMFINQQRDKIGAKGFSEEALKTTTGGNALRYFAAIRILLKPKMTSKAKRFNPVTKEMDEVQIATDIEVKNIKNKIDARQGHSGLVTIRYGIGIDEFRTLMNIALAYNVVKKEKNKAKSDVYKFSHSNGTVVEEVGYEKFRQKLLDNPQIFGEVRDLAIELMLQGQSVIDDKEISKLAESAIVTRTGGGDDDEDDYSSPTVVPLEDMDIDPNELDLSGSESILNMDD